MEVRMKIMQEWTEWVLESVRIFFQMGQNRAFHMPYIGGGGEMILKVLYRSMIAGVVVLALLLLRMLLCRAPKIYSYLLWGLVLYWLLCPFTFVSPLSFLGVFGETDGTRAQTIEHEISSAIQSGEIPQNDAGQAEGVILQTALQTKWGGQEVRLSRREVLWIVFYIWAAGIAAMFLYAAVSLFLLSRRLKGAVRMRENIYLSDYVPTPFVVGVIRPRIYLPSSLQEQEMDYIILHEQTHISRGDHIIRLLSFFALAVYWFHPLVWMAYYLSGKDMEMSCDETVMRKTGRDIRADYSTSLLNLATGRFFPGGTPLAFGEGDTKSRIQNVMRWHKPNRAVRGIALAAVVAAAVVFGTDPWRANAKDGGELQAVDVENEELWRAADAWAKAFCNRDGNTIVALSTKQTQDKLRDEELLGGEEDNYGFGWSSPWPWDSEEDYRIVECAEDRTIILYYAWTSDPHVTVWREVLTWQREDGEYRVKENDVNWMYDSISDSSVFAEAYGAGINGTPIDYLTNGAGEALNENALKNRENYREYADLFAPETAARRLLNLSANGEAEVTAGSRQADGSVEVTVSFPGDGGSAKVKMIQPYGEDGIWVVQE